MYYHFKLTASDVTVNHMQMSVWSKLIEVHDYYRAKRMKKGSQMLKFIKDWRNNRGNKFPCRDISICIL